MATQQCSNILRNNIPCINPASEATPFCIKCNNNMRNKRYRKNKKIRMAQLQDLQYIKLEEDEREWREVRGEDFDRTEFPIGQCEYIHDSVSRKVSFSFVSSCYT